MKYFFIVILLTSFSSFAQKKKVIYKYKKYEKFDFDAMGLNGDSNNPGDVSISPRFRKEFKNKIPERRNFRDKTYLSVDGVK